MTIKTQGNHGALATVWSAYRRSAVTARVESSAIRSWRWRVLVLTLAGAVTSTLADTLRQGVSAGALPDWLVTAAAIAGATLLTLAAFLGANVLTTARHRQWTVNRSVAEALKSECFRFATQVAPYDDASAPTRLLERLERITTGLGALQGASRDAGQKAVLHAPLSIDEYLKLRVRDQIDWYRGKAVAAHTSLSRFRSASIALGAVAAVLPVIGTLLNATGPASWASVATTAATAVGSFIFAERFSFIEETYTATANRLELLAARWQTSAQTAADDQRLVDSVENALATENMGWMAELMPKAQ